VDVQPVGRDEEIRKQRPFEMGDLVEVAGVTGYIRTTILMNFEGNLVQIPNAGVYKSNLRNFTTSANRRETSSSPSAMRIRSTTPGRLPGRCSRITRPILNDPEPCGDERTKSITAGSNRGVRRKSCKERRMTSPIRPRPWTRPSTARPTS
jgi:hypothetical protein